jgi:hypothetical protein
MISKKYILLIAFTALVIKADFSKADWEYRKRIAIRDIEGVASFKLDAEVYNNSKKDLSDLRIISNKGEEIPYGLKVLESKSEKVCFEPKLYNLSNIPDKYTEFYLDLEEKNQIINKLHIVTGSRNFRRKVEIRGSDDGINWLNIRDNANIFSFYTEDYITALTDINFPDSKRRFYKIIIWNERERPLEIDRCRVYFEKETEVPLDKVPFKIASREDNKEKKRTEIILDLVYNNIPAKEIKLKFSSDRYHRNVWVFGSNDADDWQRINSGVIYMYNKENKNSVISLPETGNRYLKLIIYNQDDSPLKIENISIKASRRFIYFNAKEEKEYYLFYGNPAAKKPIYEFERLLPFMESEKSFVADLGGEQFNPDFSRIKEVIKEDETFFIWPMIVFVVIALGFLIVKSLKRINEKR